MVNHQTIFLSSSEPPNVAAAFRQLANLSQTSTTYTVMAFVRISSLENSRKTVTTVSDAATT
ncbi:hypothetical protein TSUD_322740 [Trifolium subterraneum]|uniref:Uncharacterized protein n=1 Tax=Trifolium subterraneum TaxID=3900 RepID=A0A2Z6LZF3_TRISU|nr:hypothetical protein TSUD_322740 [Trifolium subterraneum]